MIATRLDGIQADKESKSAKQKLLKKIILFYRTITFKDRKKRIAGKILDYLEKERTATFTRNGQLVLDDPSFANTPVALIEAALEKYKLQEVMSALFFMKRNGHVEMGEIPFEKDVLLIPNARGCMITLNWEGHIAFKEKFYTNELIKDWLTRIKNLLVIIALLGVIKETFKILDLFFHKPGS